jgi:hypothetical protein
VTRVAKSFFIHVVHSPPRAVGYVAAPELPSQEGRAPSRVTRGSTRTLLSGRQSPKSWDMWQHRSSPLRKAKPGAEGHVVAPELISSRRQGPELRDTWQRRSSPQQGGRVRSRRTRGGAGAYLYRDVWSKATAYIRSLF